MENSLFHLINELENEKSSLIELIEIAIKDEEYLSAHFHSEALQKVTRQIWILRGLEDKNYHQKQSKEKQLEWLQKKLNESNDRGFQVYHLNQITELKKEITKLQQESDNSKSDPKTYLDEYLRKLSLRELLKIKIVLSEDQNVILWINSESNGVGINIPNANRLISEYFIGEENLAKLKRLGFKIEEDSFSLKIAGEINFILSRVKQIIAILIFEIFRLSNLDGKSYIEL
jgi:hypothetical protein